MTSAALHWILNTLHITVHIRDVCVFLAPTFRWVDCWSKLQWIILWSWNEIFQECCVKWIHKVCSLLVKAESGELLKVLIRLPSCVNIHFNVQWREKWLILNMYYCSRAIGTRVLNYFFSFNKKEKTIENLPWC